jgi:hypothetical protein
MTVIEIKAHRWGWKAFEVLGVEPVFPKKNQAIDYPKGVRLHTIRFGTCCRLRNLLRAQR